MSGGQRSIASFFGGGSAKPAAPAKPDEAENVPPATKKPRLQKKSDIAAEEAAREAASEPVEEVKKEEEPVAMEAEPVKDEAPAPAPEPEPVAKPEPVADQKDGDYVAEEEEEEEDEEDDEVESDEEDDDDDDEEGEEEEDRVDGVAKVMAAATKKTAGAKKKKGKAKETAGKEGIGDKAVEAAGRLLKHDPESGVDGWKKGEPVPYLFLANVFENISETTKRLEIAEMLTNAFRTVIVSNPDDLLAAVYLASNTIAPQHEGIDLGIGDATLVKILAEATGRKESAIRADYKEQGDLGIVASMSRSTQKTMFAPPKLAMSGVLKEFRAIATTEGTKSVDAKKAKIKKLLVAARECEAGYIVRSLQGKLRIGLAQQTVNQALIHAVVLQSDAAAKAAKEGGNGAVADLLGWGADVLKQVFSECPSYDEIVPALLMEGGVDKLHSRCHFRPGVPVKPMLAKPTCGVSEVLQRFSDVEFTCEYKYDGERAQIHLLEDGTVKIFSRNQEDNTPKFPDVIRALPSYLKEGVKSVVIDGEAVAYDREHHKILPFQILSTRGRKNIDEADIKVNVCIYAFDCLYLNGETLLQKSLTERREAMYSAFKEVPDEFYFCTAKISRDVEELQVFLEDSIADNTEGLIVKTMDATYEPSKRSLNWLKLKKDYLEGCGDSLDLVPIGAFHGRGKRTGVYGAYLLACYDEESEELQSICKIGTGFSDEQLVELTEGLRPTVIEAPRSYFKYDANAMKCDVWFDPSQVWEVKAADLSISPVHQAGHGLVDPVKGIALRFPRFLRKRDDKNVEQATNSEQVADFYNAQATKQEFAGGDDDC